MKKVIPYKNPGNALVSLDNGGRFYNLLTKANDGEISSAELAKVAGLLGDKQKMVLFLEMSVFDFENAAMVTILSSLSEGLKKAYLKYRPERLNIREANTKAVEATNVIVTGTPAFVEAKSEFTGFIMIPISTGKTMTMMMVPIIDHYDVYELKDEQSGKDFLIAHARGKNKLPNTVTRCGGIIKELNANKKGDDKPSHFLEVCYYTPL